MDFVDFAERGRRGVETRISHVRLKQSMGVTSADALAALFRGLLPPARTCQRFISADHLGPHAEKCGKPSLPGFSYCSECKPLLYTGMPQKLGSTFHLPVFKGR